MVHSHPITTVRFGNGQCSDEERCKKWQPKNRLLLLNIQRTKIVIGLWMIRFGKKDSPVALFNVWQIARLMVRNSLLQCLFYRLHPGVQFRKVPRVICLPLMRTFP